MKITCKWDKRRAVMVMGQTARYVCVCEACYINMLHKTDKVYVRMLFVLFKIYLMFESLTKI